MNRLIVDGYNVIHADDRYTKLAGSDLDAARARLIGDVSNYAAGRIRASVVFDGNPETTIQAPPRHIAGVAVLFSAAGASADDLIESLVQRWRERGERVTVVTSDAQTQFVVAAQDVAIVSARLFMREMMADRAELEGSLGHRAVRVPLQDRVDPVVREALWRWARGL